MKKIVSALLVVTSFAIVSAFADEVASTNKIPSSAQVQSAVTNKVTLKVVKVDSEEKVGEDGKASNAVDGNPDTVWHT